jgi:Tol biopolymer transport system component
LLAAIPILLATFSSSALATIGGPRPEKADHPANSSAGHSTLPPVTAVQAAQRNAFALFHGVAEGLPHLDAAPSGLGPPELRLNRALAQRIKPSPGFGPVWAIPGAGWICVYTHSRPRSREGGSACAKTARVIEFGLDLFTLGSSKDAQAGAGLGSISGRSAGLVPDGVTAVRLKGNPDRVPVTENTFAAKGEGLTGLIRHRFHDKAIPYPPSPVCPPPAPDGSPQPCVVARPGHATSPSARLVLVSRADGADGEPSDAASAGTISADGRYAVFREGTEIFIRDLRTDRTRQVDEGSFPVLSADAHRLAYASDAGLLVRDLRSGARSLVSPRATGAPAISANGRYVAFAATDRSLSERRISQYQVYLRDLERKRTTLISRARGAGGAIGDGESTEPSISANGRYVAFTSRAGNLVPGASRPGAAVYVRDLRTGAVRRVSYWDSRPGPHRGDGSHPSISADGRYVAFRFNRTGSPASVVVRDLRTGKSVNASLLTENPLKLGAGTPALSNDGRFVAFRTGEVPRGQLDQLYVADLKTDRTRLVHSVSAESNSPLSFSAAGRCLLFDTFVDANVPKGSEPFVPARGDVYRYTNAFLP